VAVNAWLSAYGVAKVKIKEFLKIMETAAGSSNPAVRSEAMTFYKEAYRWTGDALKTLIAGLKKQQLVYTIIFTNLC